MLQARAPSRLHFGLLSLTPTDWPQRRFGGVGMMIEQPGIQITIQPSDQWQATGPLSERALEFAQRYLSSSPQKQIRPQHIIVEGTIRQHVGLGTGTQLALLIAKSLAHLQGEDLSAAELAIRVGRGKRSAIGIHGSDRGSLIVDAGHRPASSGVAPMIAHVGVPEHWRVLLAIPRKHQGLHGKAERNAFDDLAKAQGEQQRTERLCRLILLGLLPAVQEQDLITFGEAVHEINRLVGEAFAPSQGGIWCSEITKDLIELYQKLGIHGPGQSSWGPTVFGFVESEERARDCRLKLEESLSGEEVELIISRSSNHGSTLW